VGNAQTAARMRAAKGYDGRPKGSKNKITKDLKKVYLGAFDALGGLQGLIAWGKKSPDLFYSQISKLLPKGIEIKSDQELTINIITAIPEPLPLPAEFARVVDVIPEKVEIGQKTASEDAPESTLSPPPIPKAGEKKGKKRVKSKDAKQPKVSQKVK
jgi:hypothetical protein